MKKDLLIIERNTRDSLTSPLTEEGYSICQAETAGAGLAALKQHKITDQDTLFVEKRLNTRPRKCLDIRTPEMVFFEVSDVALVT